ncbi:MAG: UDP-N-acetylmuramoyl-L-alanyl-D-glutamate--2,6-diaminopimelate ligase [Firmicutes bacterium]|nr:UDP-N-acetylmuramoyl-L-alanyl-D-glutamate--2,6-diaminopimelate ligase [Bacillota bacterium]
MSITYKKLENYIDLLRRYGLLLEATITDERALEREIQYISHNSLDVKEGTLFICKGLNFKAQYLDDALEKGAVSYMAEKRVGQSENYILVTNMRKAMSVISAFFFDEIWNEKLKMIGITGTKGKSTTATFVKAIMDDYCKSLRKKEIGFLSGIYTYDGERKVKAKKMTTPETIELHRHLASCVKNGCEYLVMETSSQALKYERTAALEYEVAGFLNISEDHISDREHPDIEDYFSSKLKIFSQSRIACINMEMDEKYLDRVLYEAEKSCGKVVTFGREKGADYYGYDVESTPSNLTFQVDWEGGTEEILVSIGGYYNASNALAAIAITRALGVPFENIKNGLAHVKVAGRMELYQMKNKHVDVIVDYAHNKLSYETLFENVKTLYPGRKIMLVFGCHGNKAYNRRKDLGELANRYADSIVLTEQDPGTEDVNEICNQIKEHLDQDKPVTTILDRGEAIAAACEMIDDNWVMVIAGNGADGYQKRGLTYIELPTDGERVQAYIDAH